MKGKRREPQPKATEVVGMPSPEASGRAVEVMKIFEKYSESIKEAFARDLETVKEMNIFSLLRFAKNMQILDPDTLTEAGLTEQKLEQIMRSIKGILGESHRPLSLDENYTIAAGHLPSFAPEQRNEMESIHMNWDWLFKK